MIVYDITKGKPSTFKVSRTATHLTLPAGVVIGGDDYVWNVRVLAGTRSGPPSTYLYFQGPSLGAIVAPVILEPGTSSSPGNVLTTLTPTFRWQPVNAIAGMTGYQLTLYDATASTNTSYTVSPTATSFTLPAGVLIAGDKYVWNLRVALGSSTGPVSNYLFFQAPPVPTLPAPVITYPGTSSSPGPVLTTLTLTLQWQAVTGVSGMTGYQLLLYDATKSTSTTYQIGADATSFTVPDGTLIAGDKYAWNLHVVAGTRVGPVSNYLFFQAPSGNTAVPAPVISGPGSSTAPGTTVTSATPTFQWTPITGVPGMTGYQINLYDVTTAVMVSYHVSPTASSFTLPSGVLVAGDAYVWNLRLTLGSATGPESNYLYFKFRA